MINATIEECTIWTNFHKLKKSIFSEWSLVHMISVSQEKRKDVYKYWIITIFPLILSHLFFILYYPLLNYIETPLVHIIWFILALKWLFFSAGLKWQMQLFKKWENSIFGSYHKNVSQKDEGQKQSSRINHALWGNSKN